MKNASVYNVVMLNQTINIDGVWNKAQWQQSEAILIKNLMGDKPRFLPETHAKMMYDDENLYVIFLVKDRYVRCITSDFNGPVWEDSCIEFFFSPDTNFPERYFNLEINCGGTPLMHYNTIAGKAIQELEITDIEMIEIAHSMPQILDPEIIEFVEWTVEYKVPIEILKKYSYVTYPKPGIMWKANFYKIAENSSNPHYLTWSKIENDIPDFHKPNFFGTLKFK